MIVEQLLHLGELVPNRALRQLCRCGDLNRRPVRFGEPLANQVRQSLDSRIGSLDQPFDLKLDEIQALTQLGPLQTIGADLDGAYQRRHAFSLWLLAQILRHV